jgi:hypothetical protein
LGRAQASVAQDRGDRSVGVGQVGVDLGQD